MLTAKQSKVASPLTKREYDVLKVMAAGATNRQIGQHLTISKETVKTHVSNILRKFDASCRTESVGVGYALGLLNPEERL